MDRVRAMTEVEAELFRLVHDWDRAMIGNQAEAIGRYMADDWVIIGSDGRVGDRANFLALIQSGELTHEVMTSDDIDLRVYDEAAVVRSRGVSAGTYRGQAFREVERVSCVFIRERGQWQCVLTHLSRLKPVGPHLSI